MHFARIRIWIFKSWLNDRVDDTVPITPFWVKMITADLSAMQKRKTSQKFTKKIKHTYPLYKKL